MDTSFGQKLREERRKARLSQKELARRVGVDYSYISKLETGRAESPSEELLRKIALALGIDARELLILGGRVPDELLEVLQNVPGAAALLEMAGETGVDEDALADIARRLTRSRMGAASVGAERTRDKRRAPAPAPWLLSRVMRPPLSCLVCFVVGAGIVLVMALVLAGRGSAPGLFPAGHSRETAATMVTLAPKREIDDLEELLSTIARESVFAPELENLKNAGLRSLAGFREGGVQVDPLPDGKVMLLLPTLGRSGRPEDFSVSDLTAFFFAVPERNIRSKILQRFGKGTLEALKDPYAWFLNPESHSWVQRYEEGHYTGIGIRVDNDGVITSVWPDMPADREGVLSGDRVLLVDGVPVDQMAGGRIARLTLGRPGSVVTLRLRRGESEFDVQIKRQPLRPLSVTQREKDNIRWVRIKLFRNGTFDHFLDAMWPAPEACVLDLRGNSGGLISQAIRVADYLTEKPLEVGILNRLGQAAKTYRMTAEIGYRGPLVVLVDASTASSAEILASAIQMSGRGIVIGQESEGKCYAQTTLEIAGGALLSFTSGEWRIEGRRCEGLLPDILTEEGEEGAEAAGALKEIIGKTPSGAGKGAA